MPYKPLSENEIARLRILVSEKEKVIELALSFIADCKNRIEQGEWYSDTICLDLSEPNCYLCKYRIPVLNKCGLSYDYGKVCGKYKHFSVKIA